METPYRILSIDGGGVRGLIPALVLDAFDEQLDHHVGEYFDLVAGTSTGGILALGLTIPRPGGQEPYPPEALAEMYLDKGETIFSRSPWRTLTAVGNMIDEKYADDGLEEVLRAQFGDRQLREAITDLVVPSYDIERRIPFFFKSHKARRDPSFDFPAWRVGRATAAAPTYFEPCKIELEESNDYHSLVDGGVFANNPAMCAVAEALNEGIPPEDIFLVSLGTGELTRPIRHEEATDWGIASWAKPLLDVNLDGVADTVHYQVRQILTGHGNPDQYHRFQVRLNEGSDNLDDASRTNFRALRLRADDLIRSNSNAIEFVTDHLERSVDPADDG